MQAVALRTVKAVGRLSTTASLSLFPVQKYRKMSIGGPSSTVGKRRPPPGNNNSSRTSDLSTSHATASAARPKNKTKNGRKETKQVVKEARSAAEEADVVEGSSESLLDTLSKGKGVLRETGSSFSNAALSWKTRLKGSGSLSSPISVEDISMEEEMLSTSKDALSNSSSLPKSQSSPIAQPHFTEKDERPTFSGSNEICPPPHPPERLKVEDEDRYEDDFHQPEATPVPKVPLVPRFKTDGISASRAARTYLRVQGLADLSPQNTTYHILDWILRHAARDLGYEIVPDGFVRISELLTFELFSAYNYESFSEMCAGNPRFEVAELPDIINGKFRDVRWVRAKRDHTIPGVLASNKRILNMGKLQTVVYRAPYEQWEQIQKGGIVEGFDRTIRLYQKGKAFYFKNRIPRSRRLICITLDAEKAARLGVMFFHTHTIDLMAVGKGGYIPWECVRSVLELEFTKEQLKI
ncbi:hypothetical protein CPB83DRAFT_498566 [Crepidotus variabilis]|uniref:Uncharacterized protein n=1 Tax=Crepidotus variabilis TaxID=179855 RepID=A0A9P6JMA8_9AGAR|nr:hypothetical protein CPB83DRAFT_498566 [Crepidotus variabilis]